MISIDPIPSSQVEQKLYSLGMNANFRRAFPLLISTAFSKSITRPLSIVDGESEKGLFLDIKPPKEFQRYGDRESLLMIYPEYQRQGVGTKVMTLIHIDKKPTFFVSSKFNAASSAFFQKQEGLNLIDETDRYRVYSRS
jgi:hypothetical protein